jgi:hypothetical protein
VVADVRGVQPPLRIPPHRRLPPMSEAEAQSDRGIEIAATQKTESESPVHLRKHRSEITRPTSGQSANRRRRPGACSGEVDAGSPTRTCAKQRKAERIPIPQERNAL